MRDLFFTAPMLEGDDVLHFQRIASQNEYGDFYTGEDDGVFGELSRAAATEARFWLGYPDEGANAWRTPVVGPRLIRFLEGTLDLPAEYAARRAERLKNRPKLARPLPTPMGAGSEFSYEDAEGAKDNNGVRHHAGKDWFAPGGTRVVSPVDGTVVEAKPSKGSSGQVFGGTVKVQGAKFVYVFRHVDPSVKVGDAVHARQPIAKVVLWKDNPAASHAHCEIWKSFEVGYDYENMVDPVTIYKDAT